MPIKTHHVILRTRIEVTLDKHDQNNPLHNSLYKVIDQHITPILSKLFSQYVPHDALIHLDKLVIDVGDLKLSTLDKQLPLQVEQILMVKLKEQISKVIEHPTQVIPLPEAQMQAIAHYLSEGNFAWWMVERSEKQIEKIYLSLLRHTPLRIAQLWSNLTKKAKAVQRCITLFSRTTVSDTLACLLRKPIPYFTPILTEIGLLLHQTRILTNIPYAPEQQLLGMALLGIINYPKYKVDRMGFLQMLLEQVAVKTSISYEKILEKLHTYYTQNDGKALGVSPKTLPFDQTTKALVFQLRDIVVRPPKFCYQDVKSQENILKALDQIGSHTFYQLSTVISTIQSQMDKPGIAALVKSWLKEKKNRVKLVNTLPDALFLSLLASIDSDMLRLFSDFSKIINATTVTIAPINAIKSTTLASYAFGHAKTVYLKEIQSLFREYISSKLLNKQGLPRLIATESYHPAVEALMERLASPEPLSSEVPTQDGIIATDQPLVPSGFSAMNRAPMLGATLSEVLQALHQIAHPDLSRYGLSSAIGLIQGAMNKPGIHYLIKGWLKTKQHRLKLASSLPDDLFVSFLVSIDPYISRLFFDLAQILTAIAATKPFVLAIKIITLAYCAFERPITLYIQDIQLLFKQYISCSLIRKQHLSWLLATQSYHSVVEVIILPLVSQVLLASNATTPEGMIDSNRQPDRLVDRNLVESALSKVLQALNQLNSRSFDQLSSAIAVIQSAMDQPGIRALIKNWLKVKQHRLKLASSLPYELFVSFLASIDPDMLRLFSDLGQIITATTATIASACAIKAMTLAYCAFERATTDCLKEIESLFKEYMPNSLIGRQRLSQALTTQSYHSAVEVIILPLVSQASSPSDGLIQDGIIDIDQQLVQTRLPDLDKDQIAESIFADVIDFLLDNALPKNQLVPAYVIAKCLAHATPQQIQDQLMPLCQEAVVLRKLMQHVTEIGLSKLLQAFIPFPEQMLDELAQVIVQSKVLDRTQELTNIRLIKEVFIKAAIMHGPATTQHQYIERILFHLSAEISSSPTILCDQLRDSAKQVAHYQLAETFALFKENLAPLNLDKIDQVDLMLLFTHQSLGLDQVVLSLYYSRLLPAIKQIVRSADSADLSRSVIEQLVAQHLPTIAKPVQETISIVLYKQIADFLQGKQERLAERWYLFLHTGNLGHYSDITALLNEVIAHLPTFFLAQHKTHVRQRLIAKFTHAQLILLVQSYSDMGKALVPFIQGLYQLWCAGVSGQQAIAKSLFWDSVLKTLPKTSISNQDWLSQIILELSNVLQITPTTLLETFHLLIEDTKGLAEALTTALNRLQAKNQARVQAQAIERGYKEPILAQLYLLFNGSLSLFDKHYHLSMTTLGDALVQFISDQPLALSTFLKKQENPERVARRIVHYFKEEVTRPIIACLAKDNAQFVLYYLDVLSHPLRPTSSLLSDLSTWKTELSICILHYFMTRSHMEAMGFVEATLMMTGYPKEVIYQIVTSIVATRGDSQEDNQVISLLKPVIKLMNQYKISWSTLANNPELAATISKAPKVSPPSQEVRVYTKNTGLVFLWPFFYDFFKRHNLMVGNQFCSEQAAHNAVYLLQYLVTGKLQSPEWQLTLSKLLCGLSYDAVLLPYRPIYQDDHDYIEEQQEMVAQEAKVSAIEASASNSAMDLLEINSQLLIEKVITRWKGLTKLQKTAPYQDVTIQHILKNYFLNRVGILTRQQIDDSPETMFWHLTIIHQDHDSADLLPPWSINSLKLPWMQEKIILFWMVG